MLPLTVAPATSERVLSVQSHQPQQVRGVSGEDQPMCTQGPFDDAFDDLGVKLGPIPHKNSYAKVTYQVEAA